MKIKASSPELVTVHQGSWHGSRWFPPGYLESLLQRMKRLVFAKPVTCRLTTGS